MENHSIARDAQLYQARLSTALRTARICVFEVDLRRQLCTFFENAEGLFGIPEEEILRDVQAFSHLKADQYRRAVTTYFFHPDDEAVIDTALRSVFGGISTTCEARMKAGNSPFIWCKIDASPVMENGVPMRMIGVITDISSLHETTEELRKQTQQDAFTGLYNKKYAIRASEDALSTEAGRQHALALIDIDEFKQINDTLGHAVGDDIILDMAARLTALFSADDIVSRFGGDEYLILIRNVADPEGLRSKLSPLLSCSHPACDYTNSIGIALFPDDAQSFRALFEKADRALYHSKVSKQTCTFSTELP